MNQLRKLNGFIVIIFLPLLLTNVAFAQRQDANYLEGTFWAGINSDKDAYVIEFQKEGRLRYTSATGTVSKGTWKKDKNNILIELNGGFSKLAGFFSVENIKGYAINQGGHKWRWSAAKQEAMVVAQSAPVYPPLAKAARVSGRVTVRAQINASGSVVSAEMIEGHPLLYKACEEAAKKWRFASIINGDALRLVLITFIFRQLDGIDTVNKIFQPNYLSAFQVEIKSGRVLIQREYTNTAAKL